jgi:hypothetical protein
MACDLPAWLRLLCQTGDLTTAEPRPGASAPSMN